MDEELDKNLKALKHLRELPRGTTPIESRIAAVQNLLGETEVFKTLKMLRWPQGVVCPRCHSSNVIKKEPPSSASDHRHYYLCLNCHETGEGESGFDDFTGLPVGSLQALRQWILCWYLMGFCSVNQISKVLGISVHQVIQMATLGSEISVIKDPKSQLKKHEQLSDKKSRETKTRDHVDSQEERARSFSKDPKRPGPKSKL